MIQRNVVKDVVVVQDNEGFRDGRSKKELKRKRRRSGSRSQSAQAIPSPQGVRTRSSQVVTSPSNANQFSALDSLADAVVNGEWVRVWM